ncbi:hypothetical protein UFOVP51_29 [uncultured Caudovirales phage]|uniref:Uncharacterized protein n=1 Tax=uncultured Caudovirales phage TaxID=2100421 RepID=A0A6J5KQE6_9CAUD|nr:hypothetical protein UFOVP51_29 [uncultured Caudovirales phage]CAB4241101.1 hypothetical protein UFOVP34_77 [uncultured Caudovirales phage]
MNDKTVPKGLKRVSPEEIKKMKAERQKVYDEFAEWLNSLPPEEAEIVERELHRRLISMNSSRPLKDYM